MCGRNVLGDMTWREYWEMLNLTNVPTVTLKPRYNVAPTTQCPIVILEDGKRVGVMARWGLIPHWFLKPLKEMRFSTFNARSEEAASKPMFRDAMKSHRCLVPSIGYYEWTGKKGAKQPHFITVERNTPLICFAGLWSRVSIEGYEGCTFTIMTRAADPEIAELHHRMPVILEESAYDDWLAGQDVTYVGRVDGSRIKYHPVSASVGNVRNEGPELIETIG